MTKVCPKCGKSYRNDAKYCRVCGSGLEIAGNSKLVDCRYCGGTGREMFSLDGKCQVCKGKGMVRV